MRAIAARLTGGDRRSIGQANAVAASVRAQPALFGQLWDCLTHPDAVVRMRAADALEKLGRDMPVIFAERRTAILSGALDDGTPGLRWHLVAIASRLPLTDDEAASFCLRLRHLIGHDRSRIVRVMALQALHDVAARHPALAARLDDALAYAEHSAIPSLRARAGNLRDGPSN